MDTCLNDRFKVLLNERFLLFFLYNRTTSSNRNMYNINIQFSYLITRKAADLECLFQFRELVQCHRTLCDVLFIGLFRERNMKSKLKIPTFSVFYVAFIDSLIIIIISSF